MPRGPVTPPAVRGLSRIPAAVWFIVPPGLTMIATLVAVIGLIGARLSRADGAYLFFGEMLAVCLWILAGVAALACAVGAWHTILALHKWIRTGLPPWKHPD